ncbi:MULTISPECIES: VOC family protein [Dyella]|uniref:VOC family protein n=2 Tax=Dyella TaxID=231454 RepID=A0A4R0Z300_9GAMM|nr:MULTISPECIES: VOC family protein [Dyella]TBR38823.1 VOC family protein [Dyella terrae]TCI13586.1 VOC family protein [Dyella soli]
MQQFIGGVALVVADYAAAIAWYTGVAGFELIEDIDMGEGKRWVVVAPRGSKETRLLLAQAANDTQRAAVGHQAGGRVFLFLHTDDFWRDYERMKGAGATFCEEPREEPYGTVVVFEDLYGNRWDLIQRK